MSDSVDLFRVVAEEYGRRVLDVSGDFFEIRDDLEERYHVDYPHLNNLAWEKLIRYYKEIKKERGVRFYD